MIARPHRFHGYNSLRPVYQKGQTVRGPLLALRFLPSGRKNYRAAVVVSRKVHKSAVVRNRIRRRLYEAIRLSAPEFMGSYDLVFTVFSDRVAEVPALELTAIIQKTLQKAGVLSDSATPLHGIVEPKGQD